MFDFLKERCKAGSFWNRTVGQCQDCSVGSYQPQEQRDFCFACPPGSTTNAAGTKSLTDCISKSNQIWPPTPLLACNTLNDFVDSMMLHISINFHFCFVICEGTSCGHFSEGLLGYLESPNYPGNYPPGSECTWLLKPPKGKRLLFILPSLDISRRNSCEDQLVLRKSGELGRFISGKALKINICAYQ